jgi:2-oxoglutarate ferredoxin oxidoreductase subunit alpha
MEYLTPLLPQFGGSMVQAEDEIAAIGMIFGASFNGTKAMTATSGPGFSLMQEFIGLSSMCELPIVIVDVQRCGPSTGMPTKTEQADLLQALYGTHGEVPRIVLAPSDVEDCFYQTIQAFNLSERCQMPVIILSEQALGHRRQNFKKPALSQIKVESRLKAEGVVPGTEFLRFKRTDSGVSQTSVPGMPGLQYTASGVEHDEVGELCYDPENRQAIMEKRFRKLQMVQDFTPFIERFGHVRADIGLIGWGSTAGCIKEAVFKAMQMGLKVSALHLKMLNPLPLEILQDFIASTKNIIIPEENLQGQLAGLLRQHFDFKPVRFNKYNGLPFTADEILNKILDVAELCPQRI